MKSLTYTTMCIAFLAFAAPAEAGREESKANSVRAADAIKSQGLDAICDEIRDKENGTYRFEDSHVWVLNLDAMIVCDGSNIDFEGFNLVGLADPDGIDIGEKIKAEAVEDGGWLIWKWQNQDSGEIQTQVNWVIKTDKYYVGSGAYE
ncbi:MAG: cache domain-containing protein [Roseibium sp.]